MINQFFREQLELIVAISQLRTPFLDSFFLSLKFFDSMTYYLFLLIALFYFFPKKGVHFFYLCLFGATINSSLKELLELPRPFHLMSGIELTSASSFGLPSGAAQFSFLLYYFMKKELNESLLNKFLFIFMILVSFSRLYLGVHFPIDLVAGWMIAFSMVFFYHYFLSQVVELIPYRIFPRTILFVVGGIVLIFIGQWSNYFPTLLISYLVSGPIFLIDVFKNQNSDSDKISSSQWIYDLPWMILKFCLSIFFFLMIGTTLNFFKSSFSNPQIIFMIPFPLMTFISFFFIEKTVTFVRKKFFSYES